MSAATATTSAEPDRWVQLAGIDNVRDLGGLPVAGGRRTRYGVAYRASTLQQGTADDVTELVERRGVRTIVDLRLPDESVREGHGRFGDAGLDVFVLTVRKDVDTGLDVVIPDGRTTDFNIVYQQLLVGGAASIVAAAELIADPARQGVVFHCAGGKDRTGVLAAVLLDAVGVPIDDIVADYALTAERATQIRERLVQIPAYRTLPPVANGSMSVDEGAIRLLVETLRTTYGGGARFLRDHGLPEPALTRLRAALVDDAPAG